MLEALSGERLGRLYSVLAAPDRMHFVELLGARSRIGSPLPDLSEHPALPALVGGLRTVWAHRLRGGATFEATSGEQIGGMLGMAAAARSALETAGRQTPNDSCVFGFGIRCLMISADDPEVFAEQSRRLEASGEANVSADLARLVYLSPKWHGSVRDMHDFADRAAGTGRNAAVVALKARAWIEEWLFETSMNEAPGAGQQFRDKLHRMDFRKVFAQLGDAFNARYTSAGGLTSAEAHFAHNTLAVLFAIFFDKDRLRPHLAAVGPFSSDVPWAYFGNQETAVEIAKLRRACGLPAL